MSVYDISELSTVAPTAPSPETRTPTAIDCDDANDTTSLNDPLCVTGGGRLADRKLEATTDACSHLEDARLLESFRVLTIQNSQVSIHKIPPEILASIFLYLIPTTPFDIPLFTQQLDLRWEAYRWLSVTHVCKYWRETSLLFPYLWSTIVYGYADDDQNLTEIFIKRSSNHALHLCLLRPSRSSFPWIAETLNRIAWRLKTLIIMESLPKDMIAQITSPAPLLSRLVFTGNSFNFTPMNEPTLFSSNHPRLRELCIYQSQFWWMPVTFANLTHLCIIWCCEHRDSTSLQSFLEMIKYRNQLEELILVDRHEQDLPFIHDPKTSTKIHLPLLRRLMLCQCSSRATEHILSSLVLRHPVAVRIDDCRYGGEDELESLLRASLACISDFRPSHLRITSPRETLLTLSLMDAESVLNMRVTHISGQCNYVFWKLYDLTPLHDVKDLHLDFEGGIHPVSPDALVIGLRGLTNLTRISLAVNDLQDTRNDRGNSIHFQIILLSLRDKEDNTRFAFPEIRELHIYCRSSPAVPNDWRVLLHMEYRLKERKRLGCPASKVLVTISDKTVIVPQEMNKIEGMKIRPGEYPFTLDFPPIWYIASQGFWPHEI